MEVVFADVGFGTCNVILTGSGEAIVIDGGERSKEPLAVLHHFGVRRIAHLIVSHWHEDHVGGATGLLRAFSGNIGKVWFPADPAFKGTDFWRALVAETAAGRLQDEKVEALMCTQITERCAPDLESARAARTSLPLLVPGRSSPVALSTRKGGLPNEVKCAGSVLVEITASGATVHQLAAHGAHVTSLLSTSGTGPMCRR